MSGRALRRQGERYGVRVTRYRVRVSATSEPISRLAPAVGSTERPPCRAAPSVAASAPRPDRRQGCLGVGRRQADDAGRDRLHVGAVHHDRHGALALCCRRPGPRSTTVPERRRDVGRAVVDDGGGKAVGVQRLPARSLRYWPTTRVPRKRTAVDAQRDRRTPEAPCVRLAATGRAPCPALPDRRAPRRPRWRTAAPPGVRGRRSR